MQQNSHMVLKYKQLRDQERYIYSFMIYSNCFKYNIKTALANSMSCRYPLAVYWEYKIQNEYRSSPAYNIILRYNPLWPGLSPVCRTKDQPTWSLCSLSSSSRLQQQTKSGILVFTFQYHTLRLRVRAYVLELRGSSLPIVPCFFSTRRKDGQATTMKERTPFKEALIYNSLVKDNPLFEIFDYIIEVTRTNQ